MSEGLNPFEVPEHQKRLAEASEEVPLHSHKHGRVIQVAEATLLAVVTVFAAWCGFAAAIYATESRIEFAQATQLRTDGDARELARLEIEILDREIFNGWWLAYLNGDKRAIEFAEASFRPEFKQGFDAWRAAGGPDNADARSPHSYQVTQDQLKAEARELLSRSSELLRSGEAKGVHSDRYIRITVFLASILFIVGIASTFSIKYVRYALIGFGVIMLLLSLWQMSTLPPPNFG